jgi:hypothetical protein
VKVPDILYGGMGEVIKIYLVEETKWRLARLIYRSNDQEKCEELKSLE